MLQKGGDMKKWISMALVLAMLLNLVVFATVEKDSDENYTRVGTILKEIGITQGTGKGLEEQSPLTREQALVFTLRMAGLEEEAKKADVADAAVFKDVPKKSWAAPYIAYAKKMGKTSGISPDAFGLGRNVTMKEMVTFMLRALGHTADWKTEDIMAKGRKLGITADTTDGKGKLKRGQAFVLIINTLQQVPMGESVPLYEKLGHKHAYFAENASGGSGGGNAGGHTSDKPVVRIDNRYMPKLVKATTYLYDEFSVWFNVPIKTPEKKNIRITLADGREITNYTMAPGGSRIIFQFRDQNLHGKVMTIRIQDVESSYGTKMVGTAVAVAQFQDYTPLKIVETNVLNEKSFEVTFSTNFAGVAESGQWKSEKVRVYSDGRLIPRDDFDFGYGGRTYKVIFKKKEDYPKVSAKIETWGLYTTPYHKYMEGTESVEIDFSQFGKTDIPLPEPAPTMEPQIGILPPEQDDLDDIRNSWGNNVPPATTEPRTTMTSAVATTTPLATTPVGTTSVGTTPVATTTEAATTVLPVPQCEPAYIYQDRWERDAARFFTTKPIAKLEGFVLKDERDQVIPCTFEPFSIQLYGETVYGFTLSWASEGGRYERIPRKLYVEKMIETECGAVTGPFEYEMAIVIN